MHTRTHTRAKHAHINMRLIALLRSLHVQCRGLYIVVQTLILQYGHTYIRSIQDETLARRKFWR